MCNFANWKTIKNMLHPNTNITSKYSQETHYNCGRRSVFFASNCSPLLCYRSVTTALTAQIPAETLSQSHRLCFIGKERDSETGFSYFGARYYDSDLMMGWLSVDPMADKYPGLSPYAYCAWNPVKLVDPDGRDIWIVGDDGNSYQYKKGKLYDKEGNVYSGNDVFALNVCRDLSVLKKKGLRREISRMERSKKQITIEKSNNNSQCSLDEIGESKRFIGSGSLIGYNPNKWNSNDGKRLPIYGLAHELGHAYDAMLGKIDNSEVSVVKFIDAINCKLGKIPYNEISAVMFENIVRPKNDKRTTYDGYDLSYYLKFNEQSFKQYYNLQ